jgi:hypothetical protein
MKLLNTFFLVCILSVTAYSQGDQPIDYSKTVPVLINASADEKTSDLYAYLRAAYGNVILSGQTSYWNELIAIAGKQPLVRGFDMQNYSPHNPWGWVDDGPQWSSWDDGTVQNAINWYNSTDGEGIVTFQWHWFSPSGGELRTSIFYSWNTDFDVSKIYDPSSQEYQDIIRDIDAISVQLKRLEDAGVPVIWRPLHEASGHGNPDGSQAWFWWGAKGASACLELYDVMYDRITNYHGINNLIWAWSSPEQVWYPGNDKVDILGYDSYPGEYNYTPQKSIFDKLYNIVEGEKIIAMTENGPIPDIDRCVNEDAMWSYFVSWGNLVASHNTTAHIQETYAHPGVRSMLQVDVIAGIPDFMHGMATEVADTFDIVDLNDIFDSGSESNTLVFSTGNNTNSDLAHAFVAGDSLLKLVLFPGMSGQGTIDIYATDTEGRTGMTQLDIYVYDPESEDKLLFRNISASSEESTDHKAIFAVDGDGATRWSSKYVDDQWIAVEMEQAYTIQRVQLHWETAYGKEYEVQVSNDGNEWTTVYAEDCGDGGLDRIIFDPVEASHLRILCIKRGTQWGFSLWAMEAFTSKGENAAPTFEGDFADQIAHPGEPFSANIPADIAADADPGERLFYDVTYDNNDALPQWLTFDDCTRELSGTPAMKDTGVHHMKITVSDMFGASVEENFTLTVSKLVGIATDETGHAVFDIYPNPAKEFVRIRIEKLNVSEITVKILDVSGREMLSKKHKVSNTDVFSDGLDIRGFTPGLYQVIVLTDAFHGIQKLVVR